MKDWERGYWAGSLIGIVGSVVGVVVFALASKSACAQVVSWEHNPLNYKNSPYNYANSQYNYANSQYNWENNSYNLDSKNGIYTNDGNRVGYEVKNVQGARNIYAPDGNRMGYLQ
jgi:hypothetical protein